MTPEEYQEIRCICETPRTINIGMLENKQDRTLLWGYTCERESWHVYIQNGEIHRYITQYPDKFVAHTCQENWEPQYLAPDKRLYPEACDYEFCKLLRENGAELSFTNFNPERKPAQYHGPVFQS